MNTPPFSGVSMYTSHFIVRLDLQNQSVSTFNYVIENAAPMLTSQSHASKLLIEAGMCFAKSTLTAGMGFKNLPQ